MGPLHAELRSVLLRKVLGIVRSIEVVTSQAALAAGHVSSDDEVSASCTSLMKSHAASANRVLQVQSPRITYLAAFCEKST